MLVWLCLCVREYTYDVRFADGFNQITELKRRWSSKECIEALLRLSKASESLLAILLSRLTYSTICCLYLPYFKECLVVDQSSTFSAHFYSRLLHKLLSHPSQIIAAVSMVVSIIINIVTKTVFELINAHVVIFVVILRVVFVVSVATRWHQDGFNDVDDSILARSDVSI